MPDSNSDITRDQLVRAAFRRIGMDSPSVNEKALGAERLNDVVAELDPEGRWLWAISPTETSLTLVVGTRSYGVASPPTGIAPYIQSIETAVISRGTQRIPLRIIPHSELLSSYELETTSGEPYMVALEVTADPADQKLHFLPAPSIADTIKYTFQRMLYDFDSASDAPDFKRSMRLSLIKILASELAPDYGVPLSDRQLLLVEADAAKRKMLAHNTQKTTATRVVAEYF
jgi:hypothetical protein